MDIFGAYGSLPGILKVAIPVIALLIFGAIVRRLLKFAIILAVILIAIALIYPLFDA